MTSTLLLSLWGSLAHAEPRPVLKITRAEVDPCMTLHGTIETRRTLFPRTVHLTAGGASFDVVVPAGERGASFDRFLGPGRGGSLSARWWFVDAESASYSDHLSASHALSVSLPEEMPLGEDDPVVLSVDERCTMSMLSLSIAERSATLWEGRPAAPATAVPLDLPLGKHELTVRLQVGDQPIAEQKVTAMVTPPCLDEDGDGHESCRAGDCDDHDPSVFPGATEIERNGKDDDCDGRDGKDSDRDGFVAVENGGNDCDDRNPEIFPGATSLPDLDNDGLSAVRALDYDCDGQLDRYDGPLDCNDQDPLVPRPEEPSPTGIDEDCDGLVDEGTVAFDDDRDGYAEIEGDCDDRDGVVYPGAAELPNCRDEDCDGHIDEGVRREKVDDRYEPNDTVSVSIPGAIHVKGLFGGYRSSSTTVKAITRDGSDRERYEVFAHDGSLDSFYVALTVRQMAQGASYLVEIAGRGGRTKGEIDHDHQIIQLGGSAGDDDTGNYRIVITPLSGFEELDYCPLLLDVSTG